MRISVFFFVYFAGTGLIVPYLTAYFKTLGFGGSELAVLMSLSPLAMIFVPPAWGLLADRTQRPVGVLRAACAGVLLCFLPMLWAHEFVSCVGLMAAVALFQSPITALSDTVAVQEAKRRGTSYERLRLWGSIGFILSAWSFGWFLSHGGRFERLPEVILGTLTLSFLVACLLRSPTEPVHLAPPALADAWHLLQQPGFLAFLMAGAIHWASCSPSYMLFTIHLEDLEIDLKYAGLAFALGVMAEVAMMWGYRSVSKRIPLFPLLGLSFALTGLRWFLVACVDDGPALAAIQVLHAFTFGAFYVGAISYLDRTVPASLRATGRALFTSISIGLGGLFGHQVAGLAYDLGHAREIGGGHLAFLVAAGIECLAPVALFVSYRRTPACARSESAALRPG